MTFGPSRHCAWVVGQRALVECSPGQPVAAGVCSLWLCGAAPGLWLWRGAGFAVCGSGAAPRLYGAAPGLQLVALVRRRAGS